MTFKTYHKTAPQYICDLIIPRKYNRAVRSNISFALVVPMIKLKHYGERSFSYAAPVEWNKLDVKIRSLTNLETFRKKVKTYLLNIAFTLVCVYFCFTSVVVIRVFIKFICVRDFKIAFLI